MAIAREDRKVLDYLSGKELNQGEMLKLLMKRAGIKRNDWHAEAEKRTGRVWESKSRISDMFSGKRPIPMRDIIPMIDALKLSPEETDHYCCEFFRANVPENLQRYISPTRRNKRLLLLNKRNADLEKQRENILIKSTFQKKVVFEPRILSLKEQLSSLKREYFDLLETYKVLRRKNAGSNHFEEFEQAYSDSVRDGIAYEVAVGDLDEPERFEVQAMFSSDASQKLFNAERKKWSLTLHEIIKVVNDFPDRLPQMNCYLTHDADKCLEKSLNEHEHQFFVTGDEQLSCWDWLSLRLRPRSQEYVLGGLFSIWKKQNPSDFEIAQNFYKKFFGDSQTSIMPKIRELKEGVDNPFSAFLREHFRFMFKSCPSLFELIRPEDFPQVIDYSKMEREVFREYFAHLDSGLESRISFLKYYESLSPPLKKQNDIFHKLVPVVATYAFSMTTEVGERTLAWVFELFGSAGEKFESPCSFFISRWDKVSNFESIQKCLKDLSSELISEGESTKVKRVKKALEDFKPRPIEF
ncbi:hypothetical protein ALT761_02567 [Alteromonas sp. 76-1]|uniref:helix-turn-helix domain-containing protein n=1 Tax=Alteromonas sp. 76-1 TaxID=2358187 RepID=UPI000FD16BFA|nr:helix-turn-helix transcriptional regulator [Alteromonas sp. 76-1]VEL97563.1 hypothetical protein ALT761_02567 [Alteromonas sp. 76-1]